MKTLSLAVMLLAAVTARAEPPAAADAAGRVSPLEGGRKLVEEGKFAEAIKLLGDARAAGDRSEELRLVLGRAFLGLGMHQEALNEYSEVLRSRPNHFEANLGRAEALLGLGDGRKAQGNASLATTLEPENARAWVVLGRAHEHPTVQDYAAAEQAFAKAVEIDAQSREATLGLARSLSFQKQVEKSITVLEAWLSDHPDDQPVRVKLAESCYAVRDLERAEQLIRQVLKADPQNEDARRVLKGISFRRNFRFWVLIIALIAFPTFWLLTRWFRRGRLPQAKND